VIMMGKNLRQQRRGKGLSRYRASPKTPISYDLNSGTVVDIIHSSGRRSPIAVIESAGRKFLQTATKGTGTADKMNSEKLENIPEGTRICNIELRPGSGGKICRSPGTSAILITKERGKCVILLPSKEKKVLTSECRAMVGEVSGSGKTEKPFKKAGSKFYSMKAFGKPYPRTSGVAMNAVDHPFGGSAKPGKHKTVSRHQPPGKKVGSISPKRVGKRKGK
jgi:large subunit ribosomal protein L2